MLKKIIFVSVSTFFVVSLGQLLSLPVPQGNFSLPLIPNLFDQLNATTFTGCSTNDECTQVCQHVQGGNGICTNRSCQCTECPLQSVLLGLTFPDKCIGYPSCPCPVVPGNTSHYYTDGTVMQGHACLTQIFNGNSVDLLVTCFCFCAQVALNVSALEVGIPPYCPLGF